MLMVCELYRLNCSFVVQSGSFLYIRKNLAFMTSEAEKWPAVSGETLFTKIARKEVDAAVIYEDDHVNLVNLI